jgi:hypothetical protein
MKRASVLGLAILTAVTAHLGWTPGRNIIPQPPAELAGAIWLAQVYRTAPNSPAARSADLTGSPLPPGGVTLPGNLTFIVANTDPGGPDPLPQAASSRVPAA